MLAVPRALYASLSSPALAQLRMASRISSPVITSTNLVLVLTEVVKSTDTWGTPESRFEPLLVVMMMTPFDAREP